MAIAPDFEFHPLEEIKPESMDARRYPKEKPYSTGRYLVVRKDGKKHLEQWNGTGWAYNNSVIQWWYNPKVN